MPCLLKQPTRDSPGVITFTHNEALRGIPRKSKVVRDYLIRSAREGRWIFGVHIQGDCSTLKEWPLEPWQSFFMWPDDQAEFLSNIPPEKILPLTCINFMPAALGLDARSVKAWDICVISRASTIKRITETLYLIRRLIDLKPDLKVVFVVPDARRQELGQDAYKIQHIDENYFKLPREIFSCEELRNISFLSSSQRSFGTFPLSDALVADLLGKSNFMLLTSHSEGVPRVVAEALLVGTPCILSENLRSGINELLTPTDSMFIQDDVNAAAAQILDGLTHYDRYHIDSEVVRSLFSEARFRPVLQQYLSGLITSTGYPIEGNWYLHDLHLRLACHGQKHNCQFMNNEKLFFEWLEKINALGDAPPDEDFLFGWKEFSDHPKMAESVANYLIGKGRLALWQMQRMKKLLPRF